jgi:DNA-binding Lrp family transcriptional regulator
MIEAFVMVKTEAGEADAVLEPIRDLVSVTEAHLVAGEYDVVVEVEATEMPSIVQTVSGSIRGFDGVTDSKTYLSLAE